MDTFALAQEVKPEDLGAGSIGVRRAAQGADLTADPAPPTIWLWTRASTFGSGVASRIAGSHWRCPGRHDSRGRWCCSSGRSAQCRQCGAAPVDATGPLGSPTMPQGAVAGNGTTECPPGFPIKGNQHSMLYHEQSSRSYPRTTAEFCFATPEAAQAAGFRAARDSSQARQPATAEDSQNAIHWQPLSMRTATTPERVDNSGDEMTWVYRLALATLLVTLALIVVGSLARLHPAGPAAATSGLCNGQIIPSPPPSGVGGAG